MYNLLYINMQDIVIDIVKHHNLILNSFFPNDTKGWSIFFAIQIRTVQTPTACELMSDLLKLDLSFVAEPVIIYFRVLTHLLLG